MYIDNIYIIVIYDTDLVFNNLAYDTESTHSRYV